MFQWLRSLFPTRAIKSPSAWTGDPALTRLVFGWGGTSSGVTVTEETALNYSAVWAAVRRISESFASLPCHVYQRIGDNGKERIRTGTVASMFRRGPNVEQTPFSFFEAQQANILLSGNAYGEIIFNGAGQPTEIWPLRPHDVTPIRSDQGELRYKVRVPGDKDRVLTAEQVIHVPGLGDGIVGRSVIQHAMESIGLALAAEKFGSTFFGAGGRPSGVLTHPSAIDDAAYERLKKSWESAHNGPYQAHRVAILEDGVKYEKIAATPEEAQFLASRQFQLSEVARWFNIPPHMIGDLEHATFSNIEQMSAEFVTYTLRPWLIRWESELNRKLFRGSAFDTFFVEFNFDALLRGDLATRYAAYATGRQNGWLSINDILSKENLPAINEPWADQYLRPLNMAVEGESDSDANDPNDVNEPPDVNQTNDGSGD